MSLVINFVGIMYFAQHPRDPNKREVLIIDGSNPDHGIAPHNATIDIETSRIVGRPRGWPDRSISPQVKRVDRTVGRERLRNLQAKVFASPGNGQSSFESGSMTMVADTIEVIKFPIPPRSRITVTGVDGKGVDTTEHDGRLPKLGDQEPPVRVNRAEARLRGTLTIGNGRLLARRLPSEEDNGAVVSQLRVDDELGAITIVVEDGKNAYRVTVQDDTEIVIANVSGIDDRTPHFDLYRDLSPNENLTPLREPQVSADIPTLATDHPSIVDPIDYPALKCSNTCC